jgi:hypothetical protein
MRDSITLIALKHSSNRFNITLIALRLAKKINSRIAVITQGDEAFDSRSNADQ